MIGDLTCASDVTGAKAVNKRICNRSEIVLRGDDYSFGHLQFKCIVNYHVSLWCTLSALADEDTNAQKQNLY